MCYSFQPARTEMVQFLKIQGSAKRRAPGCVKAVGKANQKWKATAGIKFTKPGACLLAEPCMPPGQGPSQP